MGKTIIEIAAGALFLLFLIAYQLWWQRRRAKQLRTWPSTEATIQSGEMEYVPEGRGSISLPCFAFSYVVGGEYYSGRFSLTGGWSAMGTQEPELALIRRLIGHKFEVRYDPRDPSNYIVQDIAFEGYVVGSRVGS